MFVRCNSKYLTEIQRKDLERMNIQYGGGVISDLDINRNFLVYAVAVINEVKNFLIYDIFLSSDREEWGWYPAILFETIDNRPSKFWVEHVFSDTEKSEYQVSYLLSHESFARLDDIYLGVCERRSDVVRDFQLMRDKYEKEFDRA